PWRSEHWVQGLHPICEEMPSRGSPRACPSVRRARPSPRGFCTSSRFTRWSWRCRTTSCARAGMGAQVPMTQRFSTRDIVAVGGSAGALGGLTQILRAAPAGFPAALFVVIHRPAGSEGLLAEVLRKETPLELAPAVDGEPLRHGRVYFAPPEGHLL